MAKIYGNLSICTALAVIVVLVSGCSTNFIMVSKGIPVGEIKIDGSNADWEGRIGAIPDKKAAVGVCKDEDYRYFCFQTSDENLIRKILVSGLTLWLNTDGSEDKTFGIKFPAGLKMRPPDGSNINLPPGTGQGPKGNFPDAEGLPPKMPEIDLGKAEAEFIQGEDDKFPRVVDIARAASKYKILLAASRKNGVLFIEIGIPYNNGFIELPVTTGETFYGLGFETTKTEMPAMSGKRFGGDDDGPPDMGGGGMPPGGGMGGGGGMPPGGGMGGGRMPPGGMRQGHGMDKDSDSQLELWLKITDNAKPK